MLNKEELLVQADVAAYSCEDDERMEALRVIARQWAVAAMEPVLRSEMASFLTDRDRKGIRDLYLEDSQGLLEEEYWTFVAEAKGYAVMQVEGMMAAHGLSYPRKGSQNLDDLSALEVGGSL